MDKFSTQEGSLNCKNISKCGKKGKLKYGIVASTFNFLPLTYVSFTVHNYTFYFVIHIIC